MNSEVSTGGSPTAPPHSRLLGGDIHETVVQPVDCGSAIRYRARCSHCIWESGVLYDAWGGAAEQGRAHNRRRLAVSS